MSQNNTLSAKAKNIVDKFINENHYRRNKSSISQTDVMKHVIVTLYAQMPNAKKELVAPFEDEIFDLHDCFTQEEINIILNECKAVIKYCYAFVEVMSHINFDDDSDLVEEILFDDSPYTIYKTPKSIIELCMRLSGTPQKNDKVFIPYGDVADYAIYAPNAEYHIECEGTEIEGYIPNAVNAFYKILLDSQDVNFETTYDDCLPDDILNQIVLKNRMHDYIFAYNPTLNQSCHSALKYCDGMWSSPQRVSPYDLALAIVLSVISLKPGKCSDFILPKEFLYDKDFCLNFRAIFDNKKEDYNAIIISLPSMELGDTYVDTFMLHIEKGRGNSGIIRLIDATGSEFYNRGGITDEGIKAKERDMPYDPVTFEKRNTQAPASFSITNPDHYQLAGLNVDLLMEIINSKECNSKYEERIHSSQFFNKDGHAPNQYLIDRKLPDLTGGEKYIPLRELTDIIPSEQISEGKMPLFDINTLFRKRQNNFIDSQNIPLKELKKDDDSWSEHTLKYYTISENCFVAGLNSQKIKLLKITNVTERIAIEEGITPFKLKANIITEDYLSRELAKEYCTNQASMLCTHYTTRMDKADILESEYFLDIKIAVPSLEEQERRCKEDARKSLEEARKHLKEADRQLLQSAEEFKRDVHMKKHAVGQTLFNLSNWWDLLERARKEGNGIVDDSKETGRIHKIKVPDIYTNIKASIEKLQMQVEHFWRADGLQAEDLSLNDFIKTYIKENQSPVFIYDYSHSVPKDKTNVTFSRQALTMIFDNIINNACSHGFENKNSDGNTIKIELQEEKGQLCIVISNNGKPVHEKISAEDVFTYGRSSKSGQDHYGIGGYEARSLMREFNGEAEFFSSPHEKFPVSYKLTFRKSNNNVEY